MLFNLLSGGFDNFDQIVTYLFSTAFVIFCTMPIHEYAHAWVATKLGDQTPRLSGRLSLNPTAHISPIGALMILIFGFGYAKPVSVNPRNFKDAKKGMAITALAGPVSNLLMALVFVFLLQLVAFLAPRDVYLMLSSGDTTIAGAIYKFFFFVAVVNINLAVFNLLPIPPLDGSRILQLLIPNKYYYKFLEYERYIVLIVFILLFTGILSAPLEFLSEKVFDLFYLITSLPFRLF